MNDLALYARSVNRQHHSPGGKAGRVSLKAETEGGLGRAVPACRGPVVYPEKWAPTSYLPGSGEKFAVLLRRRARKEPLFHPFDAKHYSCLLPLVWAAMNDEERWPFLLELQWELTSQL